MNINKSKLKEFKKVLGNFKLVSGKERHEEHKKDKKVSSLKNDIKKTSIPAKANRKWIYKSCKSKVKYNSVGDATRMISKVKRERGTKLRYYFCEVCGGYHLTKKGM